MMNEIEYGKNGVHIWIWFETASGANVELHRQTRQILDLSHVRDKEVNGLTLYSEPSVIRPLIIQHGYFGAH